MDNDKAFAAYALIILTGLASLITASLLAGIATLPSPLMFLEHLALGVGFRAAYKGIGGFDWAEWSLLSDRVAEVTPLPEPAPEPSISREAA